MTPRAEIVAQVEQEMRAYANTQPESSACKRIASWADRLAALQDSPAPSGRREITKCISLRAVCGGHDLPRHVGDVARGMLLALEGQAIIRGELTLTLTETPIPRASADLQPSEKAKR